MWHKTAPELSKSFTVVAADLRGYGNSLAPSSDSKHFNYSKREMASDMKQMMVKLGYPKFLLLAMIGVEELLIDWQEITEKTCLLLAF